MPAQTTTTPGQLNVTYSTASASGTAAPALFTGGAAGGMYAPGGQGQMAAGWAGMVVLVLCGLPVVGRIWR